MKSWISAVPVLALLLLSTAASAQLLDLPRPSPYAHVSQTVGLTDITVDYSSPAVNGRVIWGGLLPYDKLWRTGANQATKITFSKDVVVADKPVAAGSYAIFTIPGKSSWTVILNRNVKQSGTNTYKPEEDLLRFQATPQPIPLRERLAFVFGNFTESAASLDLEWERVKISIPIKLKTEEQARANIKSMGENEWRPYANAARYLLEKKDYDTALPLVDKSLALKEDWLNLYTKAALLAGKGRYKEALSFAQRAEGLGQKAEQFFLAEEVKKSIADWKTKK